LGGRSDGRCPLQSQGGKMLPALRLK
jgi:hypothetical protein